MATSIRSGSRLKVFGLGFDWHRRGTGIRHGQPGGDEGVGGHNHLVTRTDVIRPQDQMQRIQTVANGDAMPGLAISGERGFKRFNFAAQQIPARVHDPVVGGIQLFTKLVVRRLQLKEWYFHIVSSVARNGRKKGMVLQSAMADNGARPHQGLDIGAVYSIDALLTKSFSRH